MYFVTLPCVYFKVEEHCKKKKFPVLEPISPEHHLKVFRETGVDLDGE